MCTAHIWRKFYQHFTVGSNGQNNLKAKLSKFFHKHHGDNTGARYPNQETLANTNVLCVLRVLKFVNYDVT